MNIPHSCWNSQYVKGFSLRHNCCRALEKQNICSHYYYSCTVLISESHPFQPLCLTTVFPLWREISWCINNEDKNLFLICILLSLHTNSMWYVYISDVSVIFVLHCDWFILLKTPLFIYMLIRNMPNSNTMHYI